MKPGIFLKTLAWSACVVAVMAFSNPIASTGSRIVHAARGNTCDKCEDVGNNHGFDGVGAMFDCQAFNSCHSNFQNGWCSNFHYNCQLVEHDNALLLHENALVTAARLAEVAASPDWETVTRFVSANADRVQYNEDRQLLQLIGCGGRIYAQFPVSEAVAAELQ